MRHSKIVSILEVTVACNVQLFHRLDVYVHHIKKNFKSHHFLMMTVLDAQKI